MNGDGIFGVGIIFIIIFFWEMGKEGGGRFFLLLLLFNIEYISTIKRPEILFVKGGGGGLRIGGLKGHFFWGGGLRLGFWFVAFVIERWVIEGGRGSGFFV